MAKPGRRNTDRAAPGSPDSARGRLVDAAIETLRVDGFARASARTIAKRAGVNQGLVFYHFGSVNELLLAALDEVSARRLDRYTRALESVATPSDLVDVAAGIFREDLDRGYVTVLVEMIAGSASSRPFAEQVATRLAPWRDFARRALANAVPPPLAALVPIDDAAHAVVALYLGLEMLSHLEGEHDRATALFDHARTLAGLFEATPRRG